MDIHDFIRRWSQSAAAERANKDQFFVELCDVLGVPRPDPTTGDPDRDLYVFERDVLLVAEGHQRSIGKIDLYKHSCFLLEAKQGSETGSPKLGAARRGTPSWNVAMRDALGQALGYARMLDRPPPFLLTCDIGHCFDIYATFEGTADYRPFPNAQKSRIFLRELAQHTDTLRAIFADPGSLDPARHAAQVTRDVARHLAELARELEAAGHHSEAVAKFLMRCLFTLFAEDVGLLPDRLFTRALEEHWIPAPEKFPVGAMNLWAAMNTGGWATSGKLLRFNGGLFADQSTLPLTRMDLERLLEAARCDWAQVEPAIFGTLLERALDPRERHELGAHYTPRSYVERLVRPTIEDPLRAEWAVVQAEARALVERGKVSEAEKSVRAFHERLCRIRVLDPACGSGNFLYVTLDLFKRLESEVLSYVSELSGNPELADLQHVSVSPAQFRGIEIKAWAREIAELVLWIGFLQWHFRTHGNVAPREPVLHDYQNIELRDAVLVHDGQELVRDEAGRPVTRWDGQTMRKHPTTGEDVPDQTAKVPVYRFINPRRAQWPDVEFIVGNPPFLGKLKMLSTFGEGYVDALRTAYAGEVPDGSDLVAYWWNNAAELARSKRVRRFGLISTSSISQALGRRVIARHLSASPPLRLLFAIPDHPWVDSADGADVRIAMTVGGTEDGPGTLFRVVKESPDSDGQVNVDLEAQAGLIHSDLRIGANVSSALPLLANQGVSNTGLMLGSRGFIVNRETASRLIATIGPVAAGLIGPIRNGRDLTDRPRDLFVIDPHGWTAEELQTAAPEIFQVLLDRVHPERTTNRDPRVRAHWWLFRRSNEELRGVLTGLDRYIATSETAKHRVFQFLDASIKPEHKLVVIGVADPEVLGVLSSRVHVCWALATGGRLGVGNDPVYSKTRCFETFPFPAMESRSLEIVRHLGDRLDMHRKRQQERHPSLTITGMYNVLEKLRAGDVLSQAERLVHDTGLVSVLKQLHDDLDDAVLDAYGWPRDISDEEILERLLALNAHRVVEEQRGFARYLRAEVQNPTGSSAPAQAEMTTEVAISQVGVSAHLPKWPAQLPEQISKVLALVTRVRSPWSLEEVASSFKGAKRAVVGQVLDSLVALGFLVVYEADGKRCWRTPGKKLPN